MDHKGQNMFNNSTEQFREENINILEYKKVYYILDELGFSDLKEKFGEHQIRDSTLVYMESEDELKTLLKEIGLLAGPVFAFVKLWFRYKNNQDNPGVDTKSFVHNNVNMNRVNSLHHTADHKHTQTDNVGTTDVFTQTQQCGPYPSHVSDPYDFYRSYSSLTYNQFPTDVAQMTLPGSLVPHSTYNTSSWPYGALPNTYPGSNNYGASESQGLSDIINGLDKNSVDPLENFCPHEDPVGVPLEKNGSDVAIENESTPDVSNEYALFPNTEPLCSPKTSHMHLVNEKDDALINRFLQAEQENEHEPDQKSYATALKDKKEGPHSLPNSTHSDMLSTSAGERSRSSSTASANNLSRSASSTDGHLLSPTRESHLMKSPPNRSYGGIDDIDPQQKAVITKSKILSNNPNPTFPDFFDNLQESPEYLEATREKNVKPGWKPHSGKHEKSGRRLEFKPQYIDKEGRIRHGVRVRGALKSMECWLHTNVKPPMDCLFAHSRIGDTLEYICIRCTYEKPRNYECRDKKGHAPFFCNLGPYRAINGEKWRGRVEPSQ